MAETLEEIKGFIPLVGLFRFLDFNFQSLPGLQSCREKEIQGSSIHCNSSLQKKQGIEFALQGISKSVYIFLNS